jgi:predicted aldo/keto reductase-like oxidoreductase
MGKDKKFTRRNFLKRTSILGTGVLINTGKYFKVGETNLASKDIEMRYRILGKSGLKVSEIGLGRLEMQGENVLDYALDRGINYIDTPHEYISGEEDRMKKLKPRRNKVVIASLMVTSHTSTKQETMKFIENILKRMQTDYVDIVIIYNVGTYQPKYGVTKHIERLKNENVIEAVNQAKKDGKVRALGVSSHGGDFIDNMNYAIDSGHFDMIMLKYNFMSFPEEKELIEKAKQKNVGSVAIKVVGGAYDQKIKGYEESRTPEFRRAAIKWVLSNPDITNLVIRMPTFEEVDNCMKALDEKFGYYDRILLEKYASSVKPYYCRWCSKCTQACPYGVSIPNIQRYLVYFTNFEYKKEAVERYADLLPEQKANYCFGCDAPCEKKCPNNIPIREMLTEAHRILSIKTV